MSPKAQRTKDKLWVQWQGRLYGLAADLRKAKAAARGEETQELVAPFSCKVLKIHVQAGQTIKKGDPVVVVEAMKMEYAYTSPKDGTIAQVLACEGEILQGGHPFVAWKD
ncbi:MAG TPA: acetyl-CoA carboxylase biotin carboxyl carrier protein subunit [Bdellovibrionota bacterium]|jgi:3-methylcrotonyl-CoA carboxylase alpha subunit